MRGGCEGDGTKGYSYVGDDRVLVKIDQIGPDRYVFVWSCRRREKS